MPCEYVEFNIIPPIHEDIGEVPEDIELLEKREKLHVKIGDQRVTEIKKSEHFKKRVAESEKKLGIEEQPIDQEKKNEKSRHYINVLKAEIGDLATERAKTFINKLNFALNSPTYDIQIERLAYLKFTVYKTMNAGVYVKSDLKIDIFEIVDEDNLLNRMTNSYVNGMKAQANGDLVNAYKCFYLVFPEGTKITDDKTEKLDLKILRHGASHFPKLDDQSLMTRAKELLGDNFIKNEKGHLSAHVDLTYPGHKKLYEDKVPVLRNYAKRYIDNYVPSK